MRDALAPSSQRPAELRLPGHHASGAVGNADLVQNVGDAYPEGLEPTVLPPARLAGLEDDRVVLIEREQALAAPGGAQYQQRVGTGTRTLVRFREVPFGDFPGAANESTELAGDDARDRASADLLLEKAARHGGNFSPSARQPRGVLGLIDVVAENDGGVGSQPQEIARRQGAGDSTRRVDHREVADV